MKTYAQRIVDEASPKLVMAEAAAFAVNRMGGNRVPPFWGLAVDNGMMERVGGRLEDWNEICRMYKFTGRGGTSLVTLNNEDEVVLVEILTSSKRGATRGLIVEYGDDGVEVEGDLSQNFYDSVERAWEGDDLTLGVECCVFECWEGQVLILLGYSGSNGWRGGYEVWAMERGRNGWGYEMVGWIDHEGGIEHDFDCPIRKVWEHHMAEYALDRMIAFRRGDEFISRVCPKIADRKSRDKWLSGLPKTGVDNLKLLLRKYVETGRVEKGSILGKGALWRGKRVEGGLRIFRKKRRA